MQYTAASVELEEAGNERALAFVENNLGFLFAHLGKFENAHEHLNRASSIANRLNDKGYRAQVEDTRARAFLNQGLLDHAEKAAASAVKGFREGDEQSNLAAALTTHATSLARKGSYTEALSDLNEAVAVASQVGDSESLGLAALTIAEELAPTLTPNEVLKHYRTAESALRHTQHAAVRARLGECARRLLSVESLSSAPAQALAQSVTANGSLEEQVLRYEAELIRRALQASDGSVTRAARLLGVTHQGLAFILNGRQKSLLGARKPAKKRRRSIIRYH
jgi:tetratricopeptide (TPR) repeat protein